MVLKTFNKQYELTSNQRKLFTYYKMYPQDPSYNLSFLYKISGDFHLERFKHALEYLANSIPIFKYSFKEINGIPKLVYSQEEKYEVNVIDYTRDPDYEEKIHRYIVEQTNKVIDLQSWPLYGGTIFLAPNNEYYFAFYAAHIISDGYSYYTFLEDLAELYNNNVYPSERKSFFEVTNSKEKYSEQAKRFFEEQLIHFDSLSIKEIEHKRDQNGRITGKSTSFTINHTLTKEIKNFISEQQISEFTFFLACYSVFLQKLIHKDQILVGIPLPNRRSKESKGVFGYFVNTLPLYIECSSKDTFTNLCKQIKKKMISLIKYQDFDLSTLTNKIFAKDKNFTAINNAFTYYKQELTFDLKGCQVVRLPVDISYVKFPFSMNIEDSGQLFRVSVEYASLFNHIHFEQVFGNIFASIIQKPDIKIGDVELLNEQQTNEINALVNSRSKDSKKQHKKINEIFEDICAKYPDNTAIKYRDKSLTYRELNEMADNIAQNLMQQLTQKQRHVIISLDRCEVLVAAILGVLKAGRTYIPIDPNSPKERMEYIANSVDGAVLITDRQLPINFLGKSLHVDMLLKDFDKQKIKNELIENDIAYVIFTSGSTGKPKGVQVTHHNVVRLFTSTNHHFNFTDKDIWTLFHSYAFDFSVWEIFGALLFGGKLVVVPNDTIQSPDKFYRLLKEENVTVLNQTPSFFRQLIIVDQKEQNKDLSLRYIIFGGEKLDFSMLKPWISKYSTKPKLINMYGITETTVHVTFYEVKEEDILNEKGSIIGKPIHDLRMFIVNRDFQILPIGIPGEILVSGEGVSKGYYGQKDLTDEKFLSLPLDTSKIYKTGDLAKYLPDGNIEYIARIDKQIQLRGFRIELEEIEGAINNLENCEECVVKLHEFSETDKRLIAYIVSKGPLDVNRIREKLSAKIPSYMIPSHFIPIDHIPLTVNGKVDFHALPEPLFIDNINKTNQMNNIEQKVWNIWSETLLNTEIGLDDNFFDVGGTSLHVTEIYYKLVEQFNLEGIQIIDLFEYTTIRKLSNYISRLMKGKENKQSDSESANSNEELYIPKARRVIRRRKLDE